MATITSTPTATSLKISGNTTVNGTISWTCPTIPSDCTIVSCVLTGTVTKSMSKGNCTVKVNGETIEESFTIDLGTSNTTSSVATSGSGGNKNASGTVTFTNLLYTVTYKEPSVGIFNLKSGQSTITDMRVGETKIIRVYIGNTIIFENI